MSEEEKQTATVTKRRIWETCSYVWVIQKFATRFTQSYSPELHGKAYNFIWRLSMSTCRDMQNYYDCTLQLQLKSSPKFPAHLQYKLSVRNFHDVIINDQTSDHLFTNADSFANIELRNVLLKTLIVDDIVKIRADIRYSVHELNSCLEVDPDPNLTVAWGSILKDPTFADIVLKVGEDDIKAHKIVLSVRSPVFMAMFSHDLLEKESGTVIINDFKGDTFRNLLRFIYTNEFVITNVDEAMELVRAADKYDIRDLKVLCVKFLKLNTTVNNIEEILLFADAYNIPELQDYAVDYIFDNPKNFSSPKQFKKLEIQNASYVTELFVKMAQRISLNNRE